MVKESVLDKKIAEAVKKALEKPNEETSAEKPAKSGVASVDLSDAEINKEILEASGDDKPDKVKSAQADDCKCGNCGATFKGEKERCPECKKKLEW